MAHSDNHEITPLQFHWPEETHHPGHHDQGQQITTETSIDDVVGTIKDIINTFVNNQTESTVISTTGSINETVNNNNTIVGNEQTSFNEVFGSNSTIMEANNTIITEMVSSNATTIATTIVEDSNTTSFVADTLSTAVNSVVTTTETVFNTVSEVIIPTTTLGPEETVPVNAGHEDNSLNTTLCIILGVVLAALIIIIIILLIVYRRYKASNGSRSRVYCVTDLNEVSVSSSNKDNQLQQERIAKFT